MRGTSDGGSTLQPLLVFSINQVQKTRNSSADEIANVNFLRRHRTRTTKYKKKKTKQTVKHSLNSHNKVHFAYGKHTCPQLPNESLTIIDSRLNSATGSSQDMSQCYCRQNGKIRYVPYRNTAKSYH